MRGRHPLLQPIRAATFAAAIACFALGPHQIFTTTAAEASTPSSVNSTTPLSLTLIDVARLVGESNPRQRAAREVIASARADRRAAAAFANPKLGYEYWHPSAGERTIFDASRQEGMTVEIPVPIPGQRAARVAKADADIAAAQAHATAETGTLVGDSVLAFTHLLAAQERTRILSNSLADVTQLKNTVTGRRENGAASDYDVTRVELELGVVSAHLDRARAETGVTAGELATLLCLTNSNVLPTASGALQPWTFPRETPLDPEADAQNTPQFLAATRDATAAEAAIKSARRQRWPEVAIEGGRSWTRHPFGAADFLGLTIEVPIFDTRRAGVDKALSDARAAEARKEAALTESAATLRHLSQTLQLRQATYNRHQAEIVPRLERLQTMSADAYRLGRLSLLESLDAEQARTEVALDNIESTTALVEAQVRYLSATGRLKNFIESR